MMNPKKANELVLVFDEELMFGFEGLRVDKKSLRYGGVSKDTRDHDWFAECIKRAYWMPRGTVECNAHYKQIIPYVVLRNNGSIFTYCREGSEERLTGKNSIGLGGHLNPKDYKGVLNDVPLNGARREFWEEIYLEDPKPSHHMFIDACFQGRRYFLYDPINSVGQVHFGLVYILNLSEDVAMRIRLADEGINPEWKSISELKEMGDSLESWSKLVVEKCL